MAKIARQPRESGECRFIRSGLRTRNGALPSLNYRSLLRFGARNSFDRIERKTFCDHGGYLQ